VEKTIYRFMIGLHGDLEVPGTLHKIVLQTDNFSINFQPETLGRIVETFFQY
jgi:hypothetical protein